MSDLEFIKAELQLWLDRNEKEQLKSDLTPTDETHVIPCAWPTRGVLKAWIEALNRYIPKNTNVELPLPTDTVLVWSTYFRRWEMAYLNLSRDSFLYEWISGEHDLQRDGHTFWMEFPKNVEIKW